MEVHCYVEFHPSLCIQKDVRSGSIKKHPYPETVDVGADPFYWSETCPKIHDETETSVEYKIYFSARKIDDVKHRASKCSAFVRRLRPQHLPKVLGGVAVKLVLCQSAGAREGTRPVAATNNNPIKS